jgi:polysaccharide export outer membrane protein
MRTKTFIAGAGIVRLAVTGLILGFSLAANAQGGRMLNKSDVIQIKVVSQPDMDTTTRVETDGTVNFPYVGRIRAAGLTEEQLARSIEHRLAERQIVTDPHVLVETTSFGAQASVQGQVGAPGVYALDRPTTLAQILARAGGLRDSAGTVILRRGSTVRRYYGRDLLNGRVNPDRILVQNNDQIYVDLAPFYYVYGFVGHTGQFPLTQALTVQQAIAIAGGLTPLGTDSRMKIKRKTADGQTVEVPASLDDEVEPEDTIVVNERLF